MVPVAKNPLAQAGDTGDSGSIPGWGRAPGEGSPPQSSGLENPMDRGAWWATAHGVSKSLTQLSTHTHTHTHMYFLIFPLVGYKVLRRVLCATQ